MTTIVGRDCKIEVALTFDSAINPTAVTKANPGVATLTSHTVETGDVGYWTVTAGMVELDGQAVYCTDTGANEFTMNGLVTTNYSTFSAGSLTLAATWGTLSESAGWTVGGGAAAALDDTRLIDVKTRNVAGLLAPQDLTVDLRSPVTSGTALAFLEAAAVTGGSVLIKISKGGTVLRVCYGVPSIPGEAVAAGGLGSGQFNVICPGWITKPNV
jgi:hypothetical protein